MAERTLLLDKLRNIGIMAHIDAGKTTTTERILFYAGKKHAIGNVDEGNTTTDWMVQEKERGITITSASISFDWKDCRVNLIDTPGHVDFTVEVERALRVLDGAVAVFDAAAGVEPQSETVWRQANKYNVPRLAFMNKMDKMGADFEMSVKSMVDKLAAKPLVVQYPIGAESEFEGVIDLIEMKAIKWKDDLGIEMEYEDIPENLREKVEELRDEMLTQLADIDDEILQLYLDGEDVPINKIKEVIRRGTIESKFVPVFCGSAFKNKGVQPLMDAIVDYLPSPLDMPPIKGKTPDGEVVERHPSPDEPFCALAFKIMSDPYVGKLTYFRVYSGKLTKGSYVYNSSKNIKERVARLMFMFADKRQDVDYVTAGDIVAGIGLRATTTGNTLSSEDDPIILESIEFPEPVISIAVEPESKNEESKLEAALTKLMDEDPTFRVSTDKESGDTILSGMGELHLEIIIDRLKREFNVQTRVGRPQVAYRETISVPVDAEGKYIRQSGGRGQYGHVRIRFEPLERGKGIVFENKIIGGVIPREYIPAVEAGVREALMVGTLGGYPVVDVKATLYDGSYHEVDSSEMAFKIAASMAVKEALSKGKPKLMEPIMELEITTPEEYMGDIVADLNSKRAQILGFDTRGNARIIKAYAPLGMLFGFATVLRSLSQGRAIYMMKFSHYDEVPENFADKVLNR
ncbi:elongation factor G [Mesoaciditoga lauensis]|uniref:elongation factor G n=1 Tax=Mesoaciditoga lauensis TaxID=1495039 RepID=UPI000560519E|nr:elongation factor G [Mesoaciditoga lauensis]